MKGKQLWLTCLILGAVALVALSLRCYRLDGQSLWADEGNSAALATRSMAAITRDAARDIHPPLYYYLLHFWVRAFGTGEIALRSLSALMGTALVLVTYLLGRELFNVRVGLIASCLAAISPFQIYYSQETRMYMAAALWSALAVYFFLRWMRALGGVGSSWEISADGSARRGLRATFGALYVLFTTAALYTHYFSFTIPVVTNVAYGLGMAAYRPWRRLKAIMLWLGAQLAIVALYFPWLRLAGGQLTTWPAISERFGLSFLLRNLFRVFSLGLSVEEETTSVLLVFALFLLLGLVPFRISLGRQKKPRVSPGLSGSQLQSLLFVVLYLGLPIVAMYVLSLSRPAYDPKFLVLATPPFHLILARGVGGEWVGEATQTRGQSSATEAKARFPLPGPLIISRWAVTGVALVFVITASVRSLTNYYFDETYARDDYRGLARYITAVADDGDAVILNAPGQIDIFSYYYKGHLPVYPLPGQRPLDEAKTEEALERIAARHQHLFALFWGTDESDPGRFIEGWLDRRTFKALDSWHGNVRLAVYAVPREDISTEIQHPREINLGDGIAFLGYSLAASQVRAGDILQLTLFWRFGRDRRAVQGFHPHLGWQVAHRRTARR